MSTQHRNKQTLEQGKSAKGSVSLFSLSAVQCFSSQAQGGWCHLAAHTLESAAACCNCSQAGRGRGHWSKARKSEAGTEEAERNRRMEGDSRKVWITKELTKTGQVQTCPCAVFHQGSPPSRAASQRSSTGEHQKSLRSCSPPVMELLTSRTD